MQAALMRFSFVFQVNFRTLTDLVYAMNIVLILCEYLKISTIVNDEQFCDNLFK